MPIYKGTDKIEHLTKGSTNIKMVYRGSDLVYEGLPVGYTRKTYIQGSNNGYIVTDLYLNSNSVVTIDFETATLQTNLFGCFTASNASDNFSLYLVYSSPGAYIRYDGSLYRGFIPSSNTRYKAEMNSTGLIVDGEVEASWSAGSFTCTNPFYIGFLANSSGNQLRGKIYDLEIKGVAHFIPCVRDSDSAVGMYDIIGEKFYEATGNLTAV